MESMQSMMNDFSASNRYTNITTAVRAYESSLRGSCITPATACAGEVGSGNSITNTIASLRKDINNTLKKDNEPSESASMILSQVNRVQMCNANIQNTMEKLIQTVGKLEARVAQLEASTSGKTAGPTVNGAVQPVRKNQPVADDDDDDVDLFGSDDDEAETEEAARLREQRVQAYSERRANKPTVIAKSSIVLDVKPWGDDTDMVEIERLVRTVKCDGLLWGASKLVPVGYGIKKLQIGCVVEDDKVGTEFLEESITAFEDHVQSVDIAAFQKI